MLSGMRGRYRFCMETGGDAFFLHFCKIDSVESIIVETTKTDITTTTFLRTIVKVYYNR
jgi:hypothetical protein